VLNQEVLEEVLSMDAVIEGVEKVYTLKVEEKAEVFPMVFHEFNPGVADMDIKSGHMKDVDIFGLKLVSWFGENKEKSLPLLIGTTMIFDSKTGAPKAILNADHITGMRTGAAGAIGAKYLAKKGAKSLLMVGTGHIAKFEIAATLLSVDSIERVMICDPRSEENANKFKDKISKILAEEFNIDKKVEYVVGTLEDLVPQSEIIITATPSREAMIKKEWVQPGTHISCVGSDMSGKQEIDEELFRSSLTVVDDIQQAIDVGEIEKAYKEGIVSKDKLMEIGHVVKGSVKRENNEQITIFDSTGIALQDLMTAQIALSLAEEKGLGITIDL
jgi:ornithine cyclodeaminase/alanine dehydrogenase